MRRGLRANCADIEDGMPAAVAKGTVPALTDVEIEHLHDMFTTTKRFVAVDLGDEIVRSKDGIGTQQLRVPVKDVPELYS